MTLIIEILAQIWPFVLAAVGLVFGYVRHKQAQTQVAQAEKREAQAQAGVAKANEQAAQAGADAVKERTNVENQIAAAGAGESAKRLRDEWARD